MCLRRLTYTKLTSLQQVPQKKIANTFKTDMTHVNSSFLNTNNLNK